MTVDLKWRDAMTEACRFFPKEAHLSGWPEAMTCEQIAALQRPLSEAERFGLKRRTALSRALSAACESGQLMHTICSSVVHKPWSKEVPVRFESVDWDGTPGKARTVHGVTDVEVKTPHIKAQSFAEWLRKQGEEPSQHMAHWFKVRGVAAHDVLQLVQPDQSTAIPATWAQLVAWQGRKESGFVWTDSLRQIVASEKRRRSDLAHTGITTAMGAELGCSSRHINDLINGIGKSGSRKQVLDSAMARVGNGTSGKNSR